MKLEVFCSVSVSIGFISVSYVFERVCYIDRKWDFVYA